MLTDALVIGAGPAGSVTASLLSAQGWRVTIIDKASFPRNKVCGEFLSPAVWPLLKSLGISQKILALEGSKITRAYFISQNGKEIKIRLPCPDTQHPYGYGISRNRLDAFLLSQAEARGCCVFQNREVREIRKMGGNFLVSGFDFSEKENFSIQSAIVINAAGRFNRWQEPAEIYSSAKQERKICFKAHFRAAGPANGEEVRVIIFRGGYLGLMQIEDGKMNLCGTVSENILKAAGFDFDRLLRSAAEEQPAFKDWLEKSRRENGWLSCGPQTHQFYGGFRGELFYLGDAACSLEPFMGQGMTMALAGAFLAAKLLGPILPEPAAIERIGNNYNRLLKQMYRSKMKLGHLLNLITEGFGNNPGWKSHLLFNALLRYGVRKACEIPFTGYQNIWPVDDVPQWPRSTVREPAEILR